MQDRLPHWVGEREVVNWTRPDGCTYFNVPIMYLREVTREEFIAANPEKKVHPDAICFWEVSVD